MKSNFGLKVSGFFLSEQLPEIDLPFNALKCIFCCLDSPLNDIQVRPFASHLKC